MHPSFHTSAWRRGFGLIALLAVASWSQDATALCAAPPAELVWSSPADGAEDVPTDAVFFLLSKGVKRVELAGQALEPLVESSSNARVGYELGGLEPNASYSLAVVLEDGSEGGEQVATVTFETGAGAHQGPLPRAELQGLSGTSDWSHFSELCQRVIKAQDCYDTGQDTHALLDVEGEAPLYVVSRRPNEEGDFQRPVVWPGACGAPSVYVRQDERACYTVHALDETGRAVSSQEVCGRASGDTGEDQPPSDDTLEPNGNSEAPTGTSSSGCAIASAAPGAGWFFVALLPVYWARRRESRS